MQSYEGFSEINEGDAKLMLHKFNNQYSHYNAREILNGWSASPLENFFTNSQMPITEGLVPTISSKTDITSLHNDVVSLQTNIDNKLKELQQAEGSISSEKQKYTDGLTYTGIVWAAVTTTLLYFTFIKL